VRGEQDLIATYAPQAAIDTLPKLLADADDRRRFLALLDILVADPRVQADITSEQMETLQQIRRRLVPTAIDAEEICAGCTRTDDARMGTRGGES
jgi:hypothetical protein